MTNTSTVLIVDDDQSARITLEALLIHQGYELALASNGEEALRKAAELTPDVILLDVMMPGMDGFQVCRRLRADPRLTEIPVILVTALDDQESRLRGIEMGADDFVTKPYDRAELRARVRTITKLNRYRRLVEQRTRFEWMIQRSGEGYLIVADDDTILYANPQARLYLDLPQDESELAPCSFLELAQKKYTREPQAAWASWPSAAANSPCYLLQPESEISQPFWLQVDLLEAPSEPRARRLIHLRDVSAQVNSRRDVWEFHSAINHKLRTPMTLALTSLELQTQYTSTLSPQELAELAQLIARNVERLRDAVKDIFQYMSAPILACLGKGVALSQLAPIVENIRVSLGVEPVALSIPPELLQFSFALSERPLELILWEIFENALKFHPRQAPKLEFDVRARDNQPGNMVIVQIRDDGRTLSPEQLAHAWQPYYQGEKYFTGQAAGMGLGLAMVASLVWSAGGTCRLYNRPDGPGVVVELGLPLAEG